MKNFTMAAAAMAIALSLSQAKAATVSGWDVVFALDSSGSLGVDDFDLMKDFVNGIIEKDLDPTNADNRVGVVQFSSTVTTAYTFRRTQETSAITTAVSALAFTGGQTRTRIAIDESVDVWTDDPAEPVIPARFRQIFLITDGVPIPTTSQNPCLETGGTTRQRRRALQTRQSLVDENIAVNIIGIGTEWNPQILSCLVEDPDTQIVQVDDFAGLGAVTVVPSAPIPLPAGLPLLAGGLLGLGLLSRTLRSRQGAEPDRRS